MIADSFADPVFFNAQLAAPADPTGCFIRELENLADEINETTLAPENCDKWLADSDRLLLAAATINIACRRIMARSNSTRVERRIVEMTSRDRFAGAV